MATDTSVLSPIELDRWESTPCISGRLATESDVVSNRAVFYQGSPEEFGAKPYDLKLPHCAIYIDSENGRRIPGVIVQAERGQSESQVLIGFRPLTGGTVLADLTEFDLVDSPTEF